MVGCEIEQVVRWSFGHGAFVRPACESVQICSQIWMRHDRESSKMVVNAVFIYYYSKRDEKKFRFLHNQAVENDRVLRIEEENNNDTFFKKFRWIIKSIFIKMKLYYLIKYFYLKLFKSNYFYKRVLVFDKRIIKTVKQRL